MHSNVTFFVSIAFNIHWKLLVDYKVVFKRIEHIVTTTKKISPATALHTFSRTLKVNPLTLCGT